jgi:hypothetical protein
MRVSERLAYVKLALWYFIDNYNSESDIEDSLPSRVGPYNELETRSPVQHWQSQCHTEVVSATRPRRVASIKMALRLNPGSRV